MGNCMEADGVVPLNNPTFDPNKIHHTIDIYAFLGSPPSRATLMLVKALGIKHNVKIVNLMAGEQMDPDFLKMNPMHTVPTLNDNGFILWDSHVIMKYLVDQYAKDDSLCPKDAKKAAMVNQRMFFSATTLFPRLVDYCRPVLFLDQQPDPAKEAKFEEALGVLDGFLQNQLWVAGQYITIADFSVVAIVATAEALQMDIRKYPNISDWYERAKRAMSGWGYQDINQAGADAFGAAFKSKLQ